MPPSRHSSSSHRSSGSHHSSSRSSSFHSSSHSSSSHFSSGSRSSFSRSSSGVSRHSSSSHYSSDYRPSVSAPFERSRRNQPSGYHVGTHGPAPRKFTCKHHDYVYYGTSWVDPDTGTYHQQGYYDENGQHYDALVLKGDSTVKFVCQYCGTEVKTTWQEGTKPTCPNCSAQLEEIVVDEMAGSSAASYYTDAPKKKFSIKGIIIAAVAALYLFLIMPASCHESTPAAPTPTVAVTQSSSESGIYVDAIGRSCQWIAADESYYDPITECYFWYNDQIDTPTWQYWYESISSDFGDYGWMEYDEAEELWYIEISDENWIPLPDSYDTSHLWYIPCTTFQ